MKRVWKLFVVTAILAWPALAIYEAEAISVYKVADDSITVDGKMDAVWSSISKKPDGIRTLAFNDYSKILVLGPDSVKNGDPRNFYTAPDKGSVSLMAAYDSKFIYLYFFIQEATEVFNGLNLCNLGNSWRADAIEVFLDPSPWVTDVNVLKNLFKPDSRGGYFGTGAFSIQFAKPIHPEDTRIFYADRTDDFFAPRSELLVSQERFPDFEAKSAMNNEAYPNAVGVEFRIPYSEFGGGRVWASDVSGGRGMYITWGYNDYQGDQSVCTGNPIKHVWSKHYKTYAKQEWINLTGSTSGWAPTDSVQYDPSDSFDGWGKLEIKPDVVAANSADVPASPIPADWGASAITGIKNKSVPSLKYQRIGTLLDFGSEMGFLKVYNIHGKHVNSAELVRSQVDLKTLSLKPGLYFGIVNGKKFSLVL